jgi:hypothetical protein
MCAYKNSLDRYPRLCWLKDILRLLHYNIASNNQGFS